MTEEPTTYGDASRSPASTASRPSDRPPELRSVAGNAVTLWRITSLTRGAVFTVATLAAELLFIEGLPVPRGTLTGAVAVLAVVAATVVPSLRYRAWGFALRDEDVYLRRGVLFRTTSIIPHARIQHVDTRHGPVDRWLGLASVIIYTAGNQGAILSIPGLEAEEAEEVRDRLAGLSGVGDAV